MPILAQATGWLTALAALSTLAMAIATFRLAYLTANRERREEHRKRPILCMHISTDPHPRHRSIVVSNVRGHGPAKGVQVTLLSMVDDDGETIQVVQEEMPFNLRWTSQSTEDRSLSSLPPGIYTKCGVVTAMDDTRHKDIVCRRAALMAKGAAGTKGARTDPMFLSDGTYTLTICLVADNYRPRRATVELTCKAWKLPDDAPGVHHEHDMMGAAGRQIATLRNLTLLGGQAVETGQRIVAKFELVDGEGHFTRWTQAKGWGATGQIGPVAFCIGFPAPKRQTPPPE